MTIEPGMPEEPVFGEGVVEREDVLATYRRLREVTASPGLTSRPSREGFQCTVAKGSSLEICRLDRP